MSGNSFKPAWWLPNSHFQTIWPTLCRRPVKIPLERERINLPDGDFIDLDWVKTDKKSGPLVIILHGIEGSIDSHYAKGMLLTLTNHGWRGMFMHFRGCSGEPNRFPHDYHSGETNDVNFVIEEILKRNPDTEIAVIGFSLGGNVLLKWLGETGDKNPLKAAIAISVPFELMKAAKSIQSGFAKFYQWYIMKCLRCRLSNKFKSIKPPLDCSIIDKVKTMYDFDDQITAPLHGFAGVNEYYSLSSSRQYLRNINVPTLIVHAKDDPFMTPDVIPEKNELSPKVQLELTDTGGHVGFVSGKYPWRPQYWLELRAPEFLSNYL